MRQIRSLVSIGHGCQVVSRDIKIVLENRLFFHAVIYVCCPYRPVQSRKICRPCRDAVRPWKGEEMLNNDNDKCNKPDLGLVDKLDAAFGYGQAVSKPEKGGKLIHERHGLHYLGSQSTVVAF